MGDQILVEYSIPLPASFIIRKHPGDRYQLAIFQVKDGDLIEDYFNFYDQEQLYTHVDQGLLGIIIAKAAQKPSVIKTKLKNLISKIVGPV